LLYLSYKPTKNDFNTSNTLHRPRYHERGRHRQEQPRRRGGERHRPNQRLSKTLYADHSGDGDSHTLLYQGKCHNGLLLDHKRASGPKSEGIAKTKTNHMKAFKYIKEKIDRKAFKRKRLDIFDDFTSGKITYDQYVAQRKSLEEANK
jgi:hypothetical protein